MQLAPPQVERTPTDPKQIAQAVASALLLAAVVGCGALLYRASLDGESTIPGLTLAGTPVGSLEGAALDEAVAAAASAFTRGKVRLRAGAGSLEVGRAELGIRVDASLTRQRLLALGREGDILADLSRRIGARRGNLDARLALSLDRDRALGFFTALKERVDRTRVPARLDLDRQTVVAGREGYMLRVYDCLAATELALRQGAKEVDLAVTVVSPGGKAGAGLGNDLDISQVMGQFTTAYSQKSKDLDRGFNLKVGAGKLDGHIIGPGQSFSFNEVVGPRTKAQGYRMAPVLSDGEVVDGMAGGACQLSSTLFAASFFAGLELASSRPHTRPSSYIKMGLDATVVYPSTDMVLKNPYPFPVVLHFRVNQGKVRVRVLGKGRPWDKVAFVREVKQTEPFQEVVRPDPNIPSGRTVVSQRGVKGFTLVRKRLFFKGGKKEPIKTESRELRYPPTTKYIRKGTGPADPEWKPPEQKDPFGEVAKIYKLER